MLIRLSELSDLRLLLKLWPQVILFGSGLWIAKPTWAKPPALSGGTFINSYIPNQAGSAQPRASQTDAEQASASFQTTAPSPASSKQVLGKTSSSISSVELWHNQGLEEFQNGGQNLSKSLDATIAARQISVPNPPSSKLQLTLTSGSRKASDLTLSDGTQALAETQRAAREYEPILFNAPVSGEERSQVQTSQFPVLEANSLLTQSTAEPAPTPTNPSDPNRPPTLAPPPCRDPDPELGCLDFQAPAAGAAPIMYLIPRLDFFRSNNILSGIDPVEDGLIRPFALTLLALPPLGPNTYFVASVDLGLSRYFKLSQYDYNELRFRGGIFQRLSPTMSGEIGWSNQQLFIASDRIPGLPVGTRFLNDHAIRLELSRRDQLAKKLSLNTFYQFRWGFAIPQDRSRVINALFLTLNYDLTRTLQLGLDYQFSLANFTTIPRTDVYHQLLGRVTFNAFRNTQMSVYGGFSRGSSTEAGINFDSFILGVSMSVNLVIF